jgi:peptidoglycan/LPS O-acetylase OafA/YrhL
MWARNIEFMIGIWLALSPFIFAHADPPDAIWWIDFAAAIIVCTTALFAYYPPTRSLHLVNSVAGLALIVYAFFGPVPPPAYHQNHVVVGIILLMFGIIPNHASQPSRAWREFYGDSE